MPAIPYQDRTPQIAESVFLAPTAWVTGDVTIEDDVSIFFGAVLRGDILPIHVGSGTNIQEHAMLHTTGGLVPCIVGKNVTIGHGAIVHGCTVEDEALIGMGSTILDGAVIGKNAIIGAQSLVPMNMKVPPRTLMLGIPAKPIRQVTDEEIAATLRGATHYVEVGRNYRKSLLATGV